MNEDISLRKIIYKLLNEIELTEEEKEIAGGIVEEERYGEKEKSD